MWAHEPRRGKVFPSLGPATRIGLALFVLASAIAVLGTAPGLPGEETPPWKDCRDRPDPWYRGPEGIRVAANILSYQSEPGSWPKNIDTTAQSVRGRPEDAQGDL